jgi:hypothetical protein
MNCGRKKVQKSQKVRTNKGILEEALSGLLLRFLCLFAATVFLKTL